MVELSSTLADETTSAKVMFYGDAGSGKTTALAHLAHTGKVVYVEAEAGLKRQPLQNLGVPVDNILPFRAIDFDSLNDLSWQLRAELDDDPTAYTGVVFDSVTEIVSKFLEQVTDRETAKKVAMAERRHEDVDDIKRFFVDLAYYGEVSQMTRRLIRRFRDLPCHFVMSALVRRDVDENSGRVQYGPATPPAIQGDLMGYVDILGHTVNDEADTDIFTAEFRPHERFKGKDRYGLLPKRLVNPTMDRVIGYLDGTLTQEEDEDQLNYIKVLRERKEAEKRKAEEAAERKAARRK